MATDSNSKLTKFETATTIVTSEFANSIFGGLYESAEGDLLDPNDPQVIGHIHDGDVGDGHCGFIHLQDHVTSKLLHENLADEAVRVNNVWTSLDETEAIPEYVVKADGKIWYYLDLSEIRDDFTFKQIGYAPSDPEIEPGYDPATDEGLNPDPTISDTAKPLIRHGDDDYTADGFDFVFGSASLDDMHGMGHPNPFDGIPLDGLGDSRFLFDKSESAFRAGSVDGDQWDESKRGSHSVAFGRNNTASEEGTVVSGGLGNTASEECSTVSGGSTNTATEQYSTASGGHMNDATEQASTVSGGESNVAAGQYSAVSGGQSNVSNDSWSTIGGGRFNLIDNGSTYSVITGGGGVDVATRNTIDNISTYSSIVGGTTNTIDNGSTHSAIGGGTTNTIDNGSTHSLVAGGDTNKIIDASGAAPSTYSAIGGGRYNKIDNGSTYSVISGGGGDDASKGNIIDDGSTYSAIGGGTTNLIDDSSVYSTIGGGTTNKIYDSSGASGPSSYSVIGGGTTNYIDESTYSVIAGGTTNQITGSTHSAVSGGSGNIISSSSSYSSIGGGSGNKIPGATEHGFLGGGEGNECDGDWSAILGGEDNKVSGGNSTHCVVVGGDGNNIGTSADSDNSFIGGGFDNSIDSSYSTVAGGESVVIGLGSDGAFIGGGYGHNIGNSTYSAIAGGQGNTMLASPWSFVGAGKQSNISSSPSSVIMSGDTGICSDKPETITEGDFGLGGVNWGFTVDFVWAASSAYYIHAGGGVSEVIQAQVDLSTPGVNSVEYQLYFEINVITQPNSPTARLYLPPGVFSVTDETLAASGDPANPIQNGAHTVYFMSSLTASVNDFVIIYEDGGSTQGEFGIDNISLIEVYRPTTEIQQSARSAIIAGAGNVIVGGVQNSCNFIGVGDCNYINEGNYDAIISGQSNTIQSGAGFNAIISGQSNTINGSVKQCLVVGGTKNIISQNAVESVILYGNENTVGAQVTKSYIFGGDENYTVQGSNYSSAFGYSSCAYMHGQSSRAGSKFDISDPILATYDLNSIAPGVWSVHQPSGTVGTAQTFDFTMSGHWNYPEASTPVAPPTVFTAFCDGDFAAGKRFKPRDNCSYSFTFHCVLSFTKFGLPSSDTESHCVSFSFKGGMIAAPGGVVNYGNNPGTLSVGYDSDGPGTLAIPSAGTTTPGSGFEVFFSPTTTIPTALNEGVTSTAGNGFCMVVINNDATYVGANIVVKVEAVESCLQLYKEHT